MPKKHKKKTQYKIWIHVETWIDGEPIESDEDPYSVKIPGTQDDLVATRERALSIKHELANLLVE